MYDVETTEEFDAWLHNLRDINIRGFIAKRIAIMSSGSLGETRSLVYCPIQTTKCNIC
jgi:putative component of toxin-antitoxin plasmid stabilization module